jgi:hypothetical protein
MDGRNDAPRKRNDACLRWQSLRFFFFLSINYHHVDFILTVGCVGIDPQ